MMGGGDLGFDAQGCRSGGSRSAQLLWGCSWIWGVGNGFAIGWEWSVAFHWLNNPRIFCGFSFPQLMRVRGRAVCLNEWASGGGPCSPREWWLGFLVGGAAHLPAPPCPRLTPAAVRRGPAHLPAPLRPSSVPPPPGCGARGGWGPPDRPPTQTNWETAADRRLVKFPTAASRNRSPPAYYFGRFHPEH